MSHNRSCTVPAGRRKSCTRAILSLVSLALTACATVSDRYYVVATDGLQRNYYRVSIDGKAVLSTSEFQVGKVDAAVIEQLFGEFSKGLGGSSPEESASNARLELVDPATGETSASLRTVIVLSSNPEIIFTQLKSLADTKAVSSAVTGIVLQREQSEKRRLQAELDTTAKYSVLLTAQLKEALQGLGSPNADTPHLLRELLAILQE